MARVTIRLATSADLPAVGRLGHRLVELHHGFDARRFIPATTGTAAAYASFFATQLDEPDVVILVAEEGGRVVGYAYGGIEGTDYMALRGPAGVAYDLVVEPAHRRQGIGLQLLEALIGRLQARHAPRIVLQVAQRNDAAQRMFARAGFRRTMVEMTRDAPAAD